MAARRVLLLLVILATAVAGAVPAPAGQAAGGLAGLEEVLRTVEPQVRLDGASARHVDDAPGDSQGPDIVGVDFVVLTPDGPVPVADLAEAMAADAPIDPALYGDGALAVAIELAGDVPASWGVLGATPGEPAAPAQGQQFAGVSDGARGDPVEAFSWNGQGFTIGDQSNGPKGVVSKRQGARIVVLIPLREVPDWVVQDIHAFVQTAFDNVRPGGRPLDIDVAGLPTADLTQEADEPEPEPEEPEAPDEDADLDASPTASSEDDGGGGGGALAAGLAVAAVVVVGGTVYLVLRRRRAPEA